MPKVTIDPAQTEQFELKTAPADPNDPNDENGWVKLRPLPYGMKVSRRSKATRMMMRQSGPPKKGQKAQDQESIVELESMDEWAISHDFAYCIVDHNLLDSAGNKLDFTNQMTLKLLDPKVGSEIERLIDELNNEEGEESFEDFLARSTSSSGDVNGLLKTAGSDDTITSVK